MLVAKLKTAALLAVMSLFVSSAMLAPRTLADEKPVTPKASEKPKVATARFTEAEFEKLKPVLDLKNQLWTTIPWKYSLTEARQLAAKTKKPIFMVVNTGNVMGCV